MDFGWQPAMHPGSGEPGQAWIEGNWALSELQAVLTAVKDFSLAAGGPAAARQAISGLTVRRIKDGVTGHNKGVLEIADYTFNQSGLRERIGPRIARVHELAHYWDWCTGGFWSRRSGQPGSIVRAMPGAVGDETGPTWYARTGGTVEDWAESVASYVYQDYANILRAENDPRETVGVQPGLASRHRSFVAAQFAALSGSASK